MPNNDEDIEQDDRWQEYQTNVPDIEKKTGYRFFRNAPAIESIAKSAGRFSITINADFHGGKSIKIPGWKFAILLGNSKNLPPKP